MMLHKWKPMTFEVILITFIGIESGYVANLWFRDCIIEIISLTVALGKSSEFECGNLFFLCTIFG